MSLFDTYSMKTYALLHVEQKNDVTVIVKPLYEATSPRFDNDCDIIFMFKMYWDIDFHGISVLKVIYNTLDECSKNGAALSQYFNGSQTKMQVLQHLPGLQLLHGVTSNAT